MKSKLSLPSEWIQTKHRKLCTSFTSNLQCVCGMVWYWASRVNSVSSTTSHHTNCSMDSFQSIASYAGLSPQIYIVCVAWCGIGRQGLTQCPLPHRTTQTVAWIHFKALQAMQVFHLKSTLYVWHGVVLGVKG